MNPLLPDEAVEFAAGASKAFAALGGVDAARRAEEKPSLREHEIGPALGAVGAGDLDPLSDDGSLAAAAALCQAAGRVALPYPLPSVLLADDEGRPFAVVPEDHNRVDHGDLFPHWQLAALDGRTSTGRPADDRLGTRLGPFVTDMDAAGLHEGGDASGSGRSRIAAHLVLTAWQLLGAVDRAVELAVDHVTTRQQFGKPLSAFQAVQFQLADCAVAVAGLRELACFTLWRLEVAAEPLVDALALRLHALDVARPVLRTCQQLHGAAGVCDEYDISILTRHVQPALRLPSGAERTAAQLAEAVAVHGFDGLFAHGAAAS